MVSSEATDVAATGWSTPFSRVDPGGGTIGPWAPAPDRPTLASGEIHLWRFWLDEPGACEGWRHLLPEGERLRASRFRFEPDRRRYIASHCNLRLLLGYYLDAIPQGLEFQAGPDGKPTLVMAGCEFNLSHSGPLAVIAVALNWAVGVDVEKRSMPAGEDLIRVAGRFFATRELEALRDKTSPAERAELFLRFWTGKEACAKATGRGITDDFRRLDVAGAGGRLAAEVGFEEPSGRRVDCRLREFRAGDGWLGAVAWTRMG